jgi:hypothetical protein
MELWELTVWAHLETCIVKTYNLSALQFEIHIILSGCKKKIPDFDFISKGELL